MSLQVRQFLEMVEGNASNEVISYAWEQLTLRERMQAVMMADADQEQIHGEAEWLLVA